MNKALTLAMLMVCVLTTREAAAQAGAAWTDYGYFNLNVGFESKSGEFSGTKTFRLYDEEARLAVAQPTDSGAFFDFSAGARVWRNVSAGIGFHQGSTTGNARVTGSVPHPLFFNRNRAVDTSVADLKRSERAIHLQFGYMFVVNDKVGVHFLAGPSFFKLRQDIVSDIAVAEQASPFTTVQVTAMKTEAQDTKTGFNIGADAAYQVYQTRKTKIGAGMFVRYSAASTKLRVLASEVDSDSGGFQVGFGGRLRF